MQDLRPFGKQKTNLMYLPAMHFNIRYRCNPDNHFNCRHSWDTRCMLKPGGKRGFMVREAGGSPSSFLLYCFFFFKVIHCCKETQTRTEEDDGQKTSSYTMSEYDGLQPTYILITCCSGLCSYQFGFFMQFVLRVQQCSRICKCQIFMDVYYCMLKPGWEKKHSSAS